MTLAKFVIVGFLAGFGGVLGMACALGLLFLWKMMVMMGAV